MLPLTVAGLVQLYAPLAGLLGVVFWLGVLSQRVRNLEATVAVLKEEDGPGGTSERLVKVEVLLGETRDTLKSINREMSGIQRQLGNLMIKGGASFEHGAG